MTANAKPKVAFVLSGGASLGAIQAGMLHALYERGRKPSQPPTHSPPSRVT